MPFPRMYDLSSGQALRPFTKAARWATKTGLKNIHAYDDYGDYKKEAMWDITHFLEKELKIKPPGWTGVPLTRLFPTNGVTEAYEVALTVLASRVKQYGECIKKDLRPAIIIPTPTYGFFIQAAEHLGYEVIKIPGTRENNWRLHPEQLKETLRELYRSPTLYPTAFFDSNPQNPKGTVRDEEETRPLAKLIETFNSGIIDRTPRPKQWYGQVPCLSIIDDMVYLGTEYESKKPFSFAAVPEVHDFTFLMLGVSNIGLAGLRSGLVAVPEPYSSYYYLDEVKRLLKERHYFLSNPALQALNYCFSDTAEQIASRKEFTEALARDHGFNGNLMKALINGLNDVTVTEADRARMIKIVAKTRKCSENEALDILNQGTPGVRVVTSPEAGFFHLLDFSALRGSYYDNSYHPSHRYNGITEAVDEWAIEHVFRHMGVKFCSGTFTGLDVKEMIVRVTYAYPPKDIVEICRRIRSGCTLFLPANMTKTVTRIDYSGQSVDIRMPIMSPA